MVRLSASLALAGVLSACATAPYEGAPSEICNAQDVPAPVAGQNIRFERVDGGSSSGLDWTSVDQSIDYPAFAWRARITGTVVLRMVVVGTHVDSLVVVRSPNDLLSNAAREAFRNARGLGLEMPTPVEVGVTFRQVDC